MLIATKLTSIALSAIFSLTIAPAKMAAQPGSVGHVTVYDTGKVPVSVHMHLAEIKRIGGICKVIPGHVKWARSSPSAFTLRPGRQRVVTVRIGDTGSPGSHDLAVQASTVLGHRGNVKVNGGVATQALVIFPGQVAKNTPKPCVALSAPQSHGFNVLWLLPWVALALVAMGVWGAWLRHRRSNRGSHR